MQKLIFCNLDMLKYEPDREDYEKSVFFDFDIDRFREKRARFMREFKELSEESGNRVFFYSRKRDLLIDFSDAFHNMDIQIFNLEIGILLKKLLNLIKIRIITLYL